MKIAYLSSEVVPFSKTGGLADVAGALPRALAALGHDVAVFTPLYPSVREAGIPLETVIEKLPVPVGRDGSTAEIGLLRVAEPEGPVVHFLEDPTSFGRPGLYGANGEDYADNCERFALYSRGVLEALGALDFRPDVLHANDWQSALAVSHLRLLRGGVAFFENARTLFTIHNLGYPGLFSADAMAATGLPQDLFNWKELEYYGKVNLLKGGLVHADALSTVSRGYSVEIQTKEYGAGLHGVLAERAGSLHGIPNGVDVDIWDPATDPHLPAHYDHENLEGKAACREALRSEAGLPALDDHLLLGLVGRLDPQKGIDLLTDGLDEVLARPVQLVILGTGVPEYEEALRAAAERHPDRMKVWIAFDEGLAHRIEAGSDAFLMPSRYEPCGLNQMYSMRYGTVPVVRATGGLADTVTDATEDAVRSGTATGIRFGEAAPEELLGALDRTVDLYRDEAKWRGIVHAGMVADFSWSARARDYVDLYNSLGTVGG